jgi:ABC-type multidrug transport system permease subunit
MNNIKKAFEIVHKISAKFSNIYLLLYIIDYEKLNSSLFIYIYFFIYFFVRFIIVKFNNSSLLFYICISEELDKNIRYSISSIEKNVINYALQSGFVS